MKWFRVWSTYLVSIAVYFGAQNLENFETGGLPFFVGNNGHFRIPLLKEIPHFRLAFCVLSNVLSLALLLCFVMLWETMIDRMGRQRDNIKTLTQLMIRNTKNEYIQVLPSSFIFKEKTCGGNTCWFSFALSSTPSTMSFRGCRWRTLRNGKG